MQAKSCTCVPKCQEKNHTLACALKKKTNLHQHICAHHPSPRTLLFLNRSQSRDSTLAQPSDCTGGKRSLKTNTFLEGINSSSLNWHRYLISKQAYYLGQFRNKPRALSSPLKNILGRRWTELKRRESGVCSYLNTLAPSRPGSAPRGTRSERSLCCWCTAHWDKPPGKPHTHWRLWGHKEVSYLLTPRGELQLYGGFKWWERNNTINPLLSHLQRGEKSLE